ASAGAGAPHHADRRRARQRAQSHGRARHDRGRALLHVHARRAEAGIAHRHVGRARAVQDERGDARGSDEPHHAPGEPSLTTQPVPASQPKPTPGGRKLIGRALMLVITGVSLYIVAPSLIATFGSLPKLADVFPAWFVLIFVCEALAFVCIWELIRVALVTKGWFDVACSQLAGNAVSRAFPGGAATGGALQIRMLHRAGFDIPTTTTALSAVGLLSTATLFVLPVLALPAIVLGVAVDSQLLAGAIFASIIGVLLLG